MMKPTSGVPAKERMEILRDLIDEIRNHEVDLSGVKSARQELDLIGKIRDEQLDLSARLAKQLLREFRPYVDNGKLSALEGYVGVPGNKPCTDTPLHDGYDRKLLNLIVYQELERGVHSSLIGYTDWAAARIVRSGDYTVPTPAEINFAAIEQRNFAPREALKRTVSLMHSRTHLPLLGEIKDGKFNPDPDEFQRWKDLYDWNGSPFTKAEAIK